MKSLGKHFGECSLATSDVSCNCYMHNLNIILGLEKSKQVGIYLIYDARKVLFAV